MYTWAGGLHELGFPPYTFDIVHGSLRVCAAERPKALAAGQTTTHERLSQGLWSGPWRPKVEGNSVGRFAPL